MAFVHGGEHWEFPIVFMSCRGGFPHLLPSPFSWGLWSHASSVNLCFPSQASALLLPQPPVMGFCEGISEKQILCFREA